MPGGKVGRVSVHYELTALGSLFFNLFFFDVDHFKSLS